MKIIFVRPNPSPLTIGLQHLMIVEPLELEVLAATVSEKHEVFILDMILEKKSLEHFLQQIQPHVMCVTGYITHIPVMIEYCKKAKEIVPSLISVVGGVHVEKFPDDIDNEHIDFRVVRNATRTFPLLINHIENKAQIPTGVLKKHQELNPTILPDYDFYFPLPDRSLTKKYRKKYFYVFHNRVALIKTSFGCPFACKFCFCRQITGGNYFERPLDDVIKELMVIKEREIYIVDDDFLLSRQRLTHFLSLLKEHNIRKNFLVYGRADFIVNNPDIIKKFREHGLRTIIVGLESFTDSELSDFNKKTTEDINSRAMQILNNYKVNCYAAVIVSPSWDEHDFKRAETIMLKLRIKYLNLQPLTPLRGTGIETNEENLVVSRTDFARWDLAHVIIKPEKMDLRSFYQNILALYEKIIFHPKHLFGHLKYPLRMQWKMAVGLKKVRKQYKQKIAEVTENA